MLGKQLTQIAEKAVEEYGIECTMITNGSLLEKNLEIVKHLTMVGISVDSL